MSALDAALRELVERIVDERVAAMLAASDVRTPSPYLTVVEAAGLLRTTRARIDNLLSAGKLTRVKEGGRTLIERAELEAYLRGEPTGPGRWISRLV